MRPAIIWFGARPPAVPVYGPSRGLMNDIFDKLAAMRAAAEARAQRIYERSTALEARRRDLRARMDALRHLTISQAADTAAEPQGEESSVPAAV